MQRQGFTLPELLIALIVLGVIATFTIPKILAAQNNQKKYAIFKETIASLNAITYNAVSIQDGSLTPTNFYQYFSTHLNVVNMDNACGNIWTQADNSPNTNNCQAFLLHNGAL